MISFGYILAGVFGLSTISMFFVLMMVISKFPWALRCMNAKSLVFVCDADGTLEPNAAEKVVGVFKTKRYGSFSYERGDVLTCGKVPSIIVYKPIMRAVRTDVAGIFRELKGQGISGKRAYLEIANAEEMTADEFRSQYNVVEAEGAEA